MDKRPQNYYRVTTWADMPTKADLDSLGAEALRMPGTVVEAHLTLSDLAFPFVLTLQFDKVTGSLIWTLYTGQGEGSRVAWSFPNIDSEQALDMLQMTVEQARPKSEPAAPPPVQPVKQPESTPAPAPAIEPVPYTHSDLSFAVPTGLDSIQKRHNVLLGRLLVDAQVVPEPVLDEALKLQESVRDGKLSPMEAAESLKTKAAKSQPEEKGSVLADGRMVIDAVKLLRQAGLLTDDDVQTANKVLAKNGDAMKILIDADKIDEITFKAALTCKPLVDLGRVKPEQAIIALHFCHRSRVSFEDAIRELGWDV